MGGRGEDEEKRGAGGTEDRKDEGVIDRRRVEKSWMERKKIKT